MQRWLEKKEEKLQKEQEREATRLAKERERIERENAKKSANSIENVLLRNVKRQLTNTVSRQVSRGLLGALKSIFK